MTHHGTNATPSTPPGEGERRAQRGYRRQYDSAAAAIYAALERNELEWIGVADRSAGIADDWVLGLPGRVVGNQFKSSRLPGEFRLQTWLLGADGLLAPLIAAWQSLKRSHPMRKAEVCLVTNNFPSSSDTLANDESTHSEAFLTEFESHPDRSLAEWLATSWHSWIQALRERSGLDNEQFGDFLSALKIVHGASADFLPPHRLTAAAPHLIAKIADLLPRLVADERDKDRWSREDLLRELGWRDGAVARHVHQFPVGAYVQRNPVTEGELREAINDARSGYVSLVGPPGAGKSTLLQSALEAETDLLLVRYLAYVPGAAQGVGRGEAEDFFDDVNTYLKATGLQGVRFCDESLYERRAQFNALLQQAGERFQGQGVRTLIVIDGLDHVPREDRPQHAFLAELPLPQAIPDGVIFVLGTQRLDLADIKPAVQDQAGSAARRVDAHPLTREAVHRIANILGLDPEVDRDNIFHLSKGHPLVTRYLIEALRDADDDIRQRLLDGGFEFDGDVQVVYRSAWREICDDTDARLVLDYLARAEAPMPLELLVQAVPEQAIEKALKATGHLLSRGSRGWTTFHNSFRLYLLEQPKLRLGSVDAGYSATIYRDLAGLAHVSPPGSVQHWLELRYRARAGDHVEVLALATAERFREQLFEFRTYDELRADLRLAFVAARHVPDPTTVVRLLLIHEEVNRRWGALEDSASVADALLDLGDLDAAVSFIDQVPGNGYLVVDALLEAGDIPRARTLFDSLEPIQDLLSGVSESHGLHLGELREWARRVVHFRGIDQVLHSIARVTQPSRQDAMGLSREELDEFAETLRAESALAIIAWEVSAEPLTVCSALGLGELLSAEVLIRSAMSSRDQGRNGLAIEWITQAVALDAFTLVPNFLKRSAAQLATTHGRLELARSIYPGLVVPRFEDEGATSDTSIVDHTVGAILAHAELTAFIGETPPPSTQTPLPIYRALYTHASTIGSLLGRCRRDASSVHAGEVSRAARALVTFIERAAPSVPDEYFQLHKVLTASPVMLEAVIEAAGLRGEAEFNETIGEIDQAFSQKNSNNSERAHLRRIVAMKIHDLTSDTAEASSRLEPLVGQLLESTPAGQIQGLAALASSFAKVGNIPRARELMAEIPRQSLGNALPAKKDPQYALWVDILRAANAMNPERRQDRTVLLARQAEGMLQTEGRDSAYRIAGRIIEEAMLSDATTGWMVAQRLGTDGLIAWPLLVDALMIGLVTRRPPMAVTAAIVWTELTLPYYAEPYYSESRLGAFVRTVVAAAGDTDTIQVIQILLAAISSESRADVRHGLMAQLRDAAERRGVCTPQVEEAYARWAIDTTPPRHSYTPSEFDDIGHLAILKTALDQKAATGEVGYTAAYAYARLAPGADLPLARELFFKWDSIRQNTRSRFALIELELASGNHANARDLLATFHGETDEPPSWGSWGARGMLRYFRCKLELDGESIHAEAYDALVASLAVGRESTQSLLSASDDILLVLTATPDWPAIWDCLAEQLSTTRECALGSPYSVEGADEVSDDEAIASLLSKAIGFSVNEVTRHVHMVARRLRAIGAWDVYASFLRSLVASGEDGPVEAMRLLLLDPSPEAAAHFTDDIRELCQHPDFAVAWPACALAASWGLATPAMGAELAPFYSLAIADANEFTPPKLVAALGGPMRVEEALGWTYAFEPQITLLSQASGVSVGHIRERCHMLIRKWGGLERFGEKATKSLMAELRSLDMKMPYRHPHIVVAARALRHVTGELFHAGRIPEDAEVPLLHFLGHGDDLAWMQPPVVRPSFIRRPSLERARWNAPEDEWLAGVEEDTIPGHTGEEFLLGETARFHVMRHRLRFEMMRMRAHRLPVEQVDEAFDVIKSLGRVLWIDEPLPQYREPAATMLARLTAGWNPRVPEARLIICPYWADLLEWRLNIDKAWTYVDKYGAVMARSMWWRDGGPVDVEDDVIWGEGSLVLLSPRGRSRLESMAGRADIRTYAHRKCQDPDGETTRAQFAVLRS